MDISRRLGILVFCGVPAIVGGGIMMAIFGSLTLMWIYEVLLLVTAGALVSRYQPTRGGLSQWGRLTAIRYMRWPFRLHICASAYVFWFVRRQSPLISAPSSQHHCYEQRSSVFVHVPSISLSIYRHLSEAPWVT